MPPPLLNPDFPATIDFLLTFLLQTFGILLICILFDEWLNKMNACMHMMVMMMMMIIMMMIMMMMMMMMIQVIKKAISDLEDLNVAFSPAYLSTEAIFLAINAFKSTHTTTDACSIVSFTSCKLQQLDTWPGWKQGETPQLDKMDK